VTTASLVTIARRAFEGETKLARGTTLLLAVSGGPDSTALLDVAARLASKLGLGLFAHGVDHGLREEAARELDLAEEHATKLDVPFARTRVRVAGGGNLQARARAARWEALAAAAKRHGASAIATAHTADDRAETVLMRILRGAGAAGLAVLPSRAPLEDHEVELVRPLLRARRSDVMAHLERHRIPYASDPSNRDLRFVRARVRHEVLPLLAQIDPAVVSHLTAIADDLAPLATGSRGLPRATQRALADLLRKGSTSARVWLPGGLVVSRR
jgi:tRNA(Ile)-lysidine synthase